MKRFLDLFSRYMGGLSIGALLVTPIYLYVEGTRAFQLSAWVAAQPVLAFVAIFAGVIVIAAILAALHGLLTR